MATYVVTYFVEDSIISFDTDGSKTLNDVVGKKAYIQVHQGNTTYVIDIAQYLLRERRVNLDTPLTIVASTLTDQMIDGYSTNIIPVMNPFTGGIDNRVAVYDAIAADDITVAWTSMESPGIRNDPYQKGSVEDLVLSSKKRDFTNSLVSVNGVFHKTHLYNKELYVRRGFSNIKNSKREGVSVYDTSSLGGHTVIPIRLDNIDNSNTAPFSGVTLTFNDASFVGKTVLLVLGGYLHALDDTYRIISDNRVVIDTCKIDLIDEFLHNPNTRLTRDGIQNAVFEDRLEHCRDAPPTVHQKIMYYLWEKYPTARAVSQNMYNLITFDPWIEEKSFFSDGNGDVKLLSQKIEYYLKWKYPTARAETISPANFIEFVLTRVPQSPGFPDIYIGDKINQYLSKDYPWSLVNKHKRAGLIRYERVLIDPCAIPIQDKITYFLQTTWPVISDVVVLPTVLSTFNRRQRDRHGSPNIFERITDFLVRYPLPHHRARTEPVMLMEFEWTMWYENLTSIIGTIPMFRFRDPCFVYNTLLSEHTFLVVINNPNVYKKQYSLTRTQIPSQYVHRGHDTPRGTLLYNKQLATSYLVYSEAMRGEHNFSVGNVKICTDAYKTALNPIAVPSPFYDVKRYEVKYQAELLELYSNGPPQYLYA